MILPIYTYGQPVLRKVSEDISSNYEGLNQLIENMYATLTESDGVGLAAPQIGKNIRVVVIDLDVLKDEFPEYKNFRKTFINCHIVEFDDSKTDTLEEGCLSLPSIHENVTRPTKVRIKYLDTDFNSHDEWIDGYLARVVQHEFDHLDAHLFIDRISPLRKQLIKSKLKSIIQGRFHCGYKVKIKN
jgi:peptide deformylase